MANAITHLLGSPKTSFVSELTGAPVLLGLKVLSVEYAQPNETTDAPVTALGGGPAGAVVALAGLAVDDLKNIKLEAVSQMKVTGFINDITTLDSLIRFFTDTTATMGVSSKAVFAYNMALIGLEIEESGEYLTTHRVQFTLERVDTQSLGVFDALFPADSNTFVSGMQTLVEGASSAISQVGSQFNSLLTTVRNRVGI